MAQRRMFSPKIVDSDEFLEMPKSTQLLYFQLGMRADDDGFIQPRQTITAQGFAEDDLKILLAKRFILTFESGVIVIKHWLIHNLIQKDRYNPTRFQEEKKALFIKDNKAYTDRKPIGYQDVNILLPQVRLGEVRKDTFAIAKDSTPVLEVKDQTTKDKRTPSNKIALGLRQWCYDQIEKEHGVRPTVNLGDYVQLTKALKTLKEMDVKTMMEDALSMGVGKTVRSVFTDREIDIYRQENL